PMEKRSTRTPSRLATAKCPASCTTIKIAKIAMAATTDKSINSYLSAAEKPSRRPAFLSAIFFTKGERTEGQTVLLREAERFLIDKWNFPELARALVRVSSAVGNSRLKLLGRPSCRSGRAIHRGPGKSIPSP